MYQRLPYIFVSTSAHTESEYFREELVGKYVDCNIVYVIIVSGHRTKDFAKDVPRRRPVNSSAIQQCTRCSVINELSEGPCLGSDNPAVLVVGNIDSDWVVVVECLSRFALGRI